MKQTIKFGEEVKGYNIPVLNEREIRASSGVLFLLAFVSLLLIIFRSDFLLAKYFVIFFIVDFFIRLHISPKLSPTLILGRLIVSNQTPEYVGAPQKKFAWKIGIILATIMFFLLVLYNSYSIITGLICLICLLFLFFESAFGICLGCIFYGWVYKDKAQYCPGEICDIKDRSEIQKTSRKQVLILIGFILFIVLTIFLFNDTLLSHPDSLWLKLDELFG